MAQQEDRRKSLQAAQADAMSPLMFSLQALLTRHETYIADSEREREAMTAHIEALEAEKQALEWKNATVIEENRGLLDQLEAVNNAVAESDAHVTSLQATLQSTQQELNKLAQLASRTERLEQQLADFERDQTTWQSSLEAKEESEKSAVRRWQKAERTLANLQDQIERIEREAKEEKERHVEVVGRMERRRAVERELTSAAGRLKGAAAAKVDGRDAGGTTVVSQFVKDILQDNSNLQMGIVELREMLTTSNEEVETLRQLLSLHQPAEDNDEQAQTTAPRKDLRDEMVRANSQELHVHHHYHAAPTPPKPTGVKRTKKKRYGALTSGHFTPPSRSSTPRSSISYATPTPTATILQQTAASLPQSVPSTHRSSLQMTSWSGPSSPQSTTNRTSSPFERVFSDTGHDSSRPNTPDTEDPGSPNFAPSHTKRPSASSFRSYTAPVAYRSGLGKYSLDAILSMEELPKLDPPVTESMAIPEETEQEWEDHVSHLAGESSSYTSPLSEDTLGRLQNQHFLQRPIPRAASHESLISVSGMDIHTLKTRPSQLLAPYGSPLTSQAVISDTTAHAARPAVMSRTPGSSHTLLSGMAADQRQTPKATLGKKVGGWVFGRWGATPSPGSVDTTPRAVQKTEKAPSVSSSSDPPQTDPRATPKLRLAGINQPGPILGFAPEVKTAQVPVVKSLDEEGLRSALDGL